MNIIFSNNLNYWLEQRGKTQADLYRKMGVSSATTSDWCNGKKTPRVDKIAAIAKWLMIEISDLISEKPRTEITELDKIIFRIRDDEEFYKIVSNINKLNEFDFSKVNDYIDLLKKAGD